MYAGHSPELRSEKYGCGMGQIAHTTAVKDRWSLFFGPDFFFPLGLSVLGDYGTVT